MTWKNVQTISMYRFLKIFYFPGIGKKIIVRFISWSETAKNILKTKNNKGKLALLYKKLYIINDRNPINRIIYTTYYM